MPEYKANQRGYLYTRKGYARTSNGRWIASLRSSDPRGKYASYRTGKRCPDGTYKRRYGKSAGYCTTNKQKAGRMPCSLMTRRGRDRSRRCEGKKRDDYT